MRLMMRPDTKKSKPKAKMKKAALSSSDREETENKQQENGKLSLSSG